MSHVLRLSRRAMACQCEVVVVHETVAAATHAAAAALDEISRVEALLSRYDATSEVARINRDAIRRPICVDYELCELLSRCRDACQDTAGAFDIAVRQTEPTSQGRWQLDTGLRAVTFESETVQLDLGGCGKGYALDCAAGVLQAAGVTNALLHAGTSSILSLGTSPDGGPWPITLADPRDRSAAPLPCPLSFRALSMSAAGPDGATLDPRTGQPLGGLRSCGATAATAFDAEVWSTAGLILGREGIRLLPPVALTRRWHQLLWLTPIDNGWHTDIL